MVANRRYAPDYDASIATYVANLDANGLRGGVLVQPSFLGTDNAFLADTLTQHRDRLRGVAVLAHDASEASIDHLHVLGVRAHRFNLVGRDAAEATTAQALDLIDRVSERGWHVEVHAHAANLKPILDAWSARNATIVVDHMGLPDPSLGIADPDFQALLDRGRAGRHPIYVKLSAPYRHRGGPSAQYASALLNAFGASRCLWGSDWPWTQFEGQHSYADTLAWFDGWIAMSAVDDKAQAISQINAASAELFGFPARRN